MKFLSFVLCTVLALGFTVNAFATELEENLLDPIEVTETETEASTGDEYLDTVLNYMQNDISNLQTDVESINGEIEVINDVLDSMSESNSVADSSIEDDTVSVSETETEVNPELGIEDGEIVGIALMSVAPITPESTTGLKSLLLSVIGDYDPVIVEYEYQNNNNYSSYLREVLPDYPWFASFLMLALMVYCLFRLGGACLG